MSVVKETLKDDEASFSRENNEFSTESGSQVAELSMKNIHQETPENYGFTCHTVCDFPGEEEGDLAFAEGEILTVLGIRDDGWWEAENADGKRGLVPSNFLSVPEPRKTLIESLLQSDKSQRTSFWKHLRSTDREAQALEAALKNSGAYPIGFCYSVLAHLLKTDSNFTMESAFRPKLNDTGLAFEDFFWDSPPRNLAIRHTVLQKIIHLVAIRQVIRPPPGMHVISRHVRMCHHDGHKVLSNIHTVKAKWDARTPNLWTFNSKVSTESSLEEGLIFIRSDKCFATSGIFFELCISHKKENSEVVEMSCGWAYMNLFDDMGKPINSRARVLKVHNTVPFAIHHDTSHPEHPSVLKKFRNRRKLPRLVVSMFNPEQSLNHQICTLPTSLIGPVCSIPILSLYREITADDLLERPSSDSTERIMSPYLATFSRIFNEVDFADVFRILWTERVKSEKLNDLKKSSYRKKVFREMYMKTVFIMSKCCNLGAFSVERSLLDQDRSAEIRKLMNMFQESGHKAMVLSPAVEFKPLSITDFSVNVIPEF